MPTRNISHPQRAHAAPQNDQAEEEARHLVTVALKKIQNEVLQRRAHGQPWTAILAWLLTLGLGC